MGAERRRSTGARTMSGSFRRSAAASTITAAPASSSSRNIMNPGPDLPWTQQRSRQAKLDRRRCQGCCQPQPPPCLPRSSCQGAGRREAEAPSGRDSAALPRQRRSCPRVSNRQRFSCRSMVPCTASAAASVDRVGPAGTREEEALLVAGACILGASRCQSLRNSTRTELPGKWGPGAAPTQLSTLGGESKGYSTTLALSASTNAATSTCCRYFSAACTWIGQWRGRHSIAAA